MESSQSKEEFWASTILVILVLSRHNVKLMNHNWGSRPNKRGVTLQIIRENMDNHECFIPWSRGGWIAGKKEKGTMIKFSGHMYVHTLGHEGAVGCLFYPSEEI